MLPGIMIRQRSVHSFVPSTVILHRQSISPRDGLSSTVLQPSTPSRTITSLVLFPNSGTVKRSTGSRQYSSSSNYGSSFRYWPVYLIIGTNILIFGLYNIYGTENYRLRLFYSEHMVLSKSRLYRHYYTLLSYSYTQIDLMHILTNMITLYSFGTFGMDLLGTSRFFGLYTVGGIMSGISQLVYNQYTPRLNIPASYSTRTDNSLLGASGSIASILGYCLIRNPHGTTILLIIPVPNRILLGLFISGSLYCSYSGAQPGWAHFGHLGGMLTGMAYGSFHRYGRIYR